MSDTATRTRAVPALAIDDLTYSYPHAPQPALRDISLDLAPGEFALLAGRSACGKSTLLRAACGLVPHFHGGEIDGRIEVAGINAIVSGPGELAVAVGYVAQDPETQVVSTTVAAEIELPLELRGRPADLPRKSSRGGGPRSGDSSPARQSRGHPFGRRAATRSSCSRIGHPPAPGASRRADLPARPCSRRRAHMAPAPPQRGVGRNRPARRAPPRALPCRSRSRHSHDLRLNRLRWRPSRLPHLGARCRHGPGDPVSPPILLVQHRASTGGC